MYKIIPWNKRSSLFWSNYSLNQNHNAFRTLLKKLHLRPEKQIEVSVFFLTTQFSVFSRLSLVQESNRCSTWFQIEGNPTDFHLILIGSPLFLINSLLDAANKICDVQNIRLRKLIYVETMRKKQMKATNSHINLKWLQPRYLQKSSIYNINLVQLCATYRK